MGGSLQYLQDLYNYFPIVTQEVLKIPCHTMCHHQQLLESGLGEVTFEAIKVLEESLN